MSGITLVPNKGLRPSTPQIRGTHYLVESIGAMPYEDVLVAVEKFSRIDTSSLGTLAFPYPQLFVLNDTIIVCTSTAIYEYSGGALSAAKISSLTAGTTWSVVDIKRFLLFVNGQVAVVRDAISGAYALKSDIPFGTCCGNYNGQIFIGSPDVPASGDI